MAKYYLQKYHSDLFHPLHSMVYTYYLTCIKVSFWGLIKKKVVITYDIDGGHNISDYFKHWDNLIEKKIPFKK